MRFLVTYLLLVAALGGCSSAPPKTAPLPVAPATFRETDPRWTVATPAESQPRGTWWKAFRDPILDGLV